MGWVQQPYREAGTCMQNFTANRVLGALLLVATILTVIPPVQGAGTEGATGTTAAPSEKPGGGPAAVPAEESEEEEEEEEPTTTAEQAPTAVPIDYSQPQFYDEALCFALFPARPDRKTRRLAYVTRPLITYRHLENDRAYELSFVDLEDPWPLEKTLMIEDPTRLYDLFEVNRGTECSGTLKDCDTEYLGFKARQYELRFASPKDPSVKLVERKIMFIVAHRLYLVGCTGPADWVESKGATKLMDSISLGRTRPAAQRAEFHWAHETRVKDIQAIAKAAAEKAALAQKHAIAASFNATVPHLPYVATFPYKVRLLRSGEDCVLFDTTKSVHEVFVFYTTKLRENGWTFENAPAGTIKGFADLQKSSSAGVGITIKVTRTAEATTRVSLDWVRGTIVKTYVYRRQ